MTSPRGITAARPPFFILRVVARPLGFIDIGDLKRLRCLLEPCFEFFHFSENNCRTKCFGKTLWAYAFIFSFFRKRLPDQVLRKSFVGVLGSSWHLLGSLEALLEPPGALLGASWSLLGRSWGGLRASWDPLGPSWRRPKTRQKQRAFLSPQKYPKKSCSHIFLAPFWTPKSTKMAPKTSPNLRRFSRAKQIVFKSLLEPSWADLEAFWRPSWAPNLRSGISGRSIW